MYLKYALLADHASLDSNNKVNIHGIFDTLFTPNFPVIVQSKFLVLKFEGSPTEIGNHKISVELRDNKANKINSFEQTLNVVAERPNTRGVRAGIIMAFQMLPFEKAGDYEFVIFLNDRFMGRVNLLLKKMGDP